MTVPVAAQVVDLVAIGRGRFRRGRTPKPAVPQNLLDHVGLRRFDEGDDLHLATTLRTSRGVARISAEVIDVRSLSPLDYETMGESVRKTGRVVIVEEGPKTGSISAEIAAGMMERFGDCLRCPIRRVASADVPVPFSPVLENAYRPDSPRIVEAARAVMQF